MTPSSSKNIPGTNICLMESFDFFSPLARCSPATGIFMRIFSTLPLKSLYCCPTRILLRYVDMPPTFRSMDILLSFSTTRQPVLISAILFMASYTIPPVKEPSPITAAIFSFVPLILLAHAIPSAAEMDVELCPVLNASHGLSLVFGKPLIPPNCLRVPISFFLPVSILWT